LHELRILPLQLSELLHGFSKVLRIKDDIADAKDGQGRRGDA
jgi:hypothetical protein